MQLHAGRKQGNQKNIVIGYKVFSDAQTGGTANICFFFLLTNLYYIIQEGQIYLQTEKQLFVLSCQEGPKRHCHQMKRRKYDKLKYNIE